MTTTAESINPSPAQPAAAFTSMSSMSPGAVAPGKPAPGAAKPITWRFEDVSAKAGVQVILHPD